MRSISRFNCPMCCQMAALVVQRVHKEDMVAWRYLINIDVPSSAECGLHSLPAALHPRRCADAFVRELTAKDTRGKTCTEASHLILACAGNIETAVALRNDGRSPKVRIEANLRQRAKGVTWRTTARRRPFQFN